MRTHVAGSPISRGPKPGVQQEMLVSDCFRICCFHCFGLLFSTLVDVLTLLERMCAPPSDSTLPQQTGNAQHATGFIRLPPGTSDTGTRLRAGMGAPPSASTALQLVEDAPHAAWGEPLNTQVPWYGDAHPASQARASKTCSFNSKARLLCQQSD